MQQVAFLLFVLAMLEIGGEQAYRDVREGPRMALWTPSSVSGANKPSKVVDMTAVRAIICQQTRCTIIAAFS